MATDISSISSAPPHLALVGPGGSLPLDRRTIETLAELFVALLDLSEPDPDIEPNGDELDTNNAEDETLHSAFGGGPGCIYSDSDTSVDDHPCDAYTEDGV